MLRTIEEYAAHLATARAHRARLLADVDRSRGPCVYRVFDETDRLLYVGATIDLPARIGEHSRHTDWMAAAARITRTNYPTRDEAATAEHAAIQAEDPMWNRAEQFDTWMGRA